MRRLAMAYLTVGGIGHLPWLHGTVASVVSVPCFLLLRAALPPGPLPALLLAAALLALSALALPAIRRCTPASDPDQRWIVIDEVIGTGVAILPVFLFPVAVTPYVVAGVTLFRFFDIAKPLGIGSIDRRKTPLSVILDDAAAGAYAMLCASALLTVL